MTVDRLDNSSIGNGGFGAFPILLLPLKWFPHFALTFFTLIFWQLYLDKYFALTFFTLIFLCPYFVLIFWQLYLDKYFGKLYVFPIESAFNILRSHFDWFHSNKNYYNYQFHHDTIFFVLIINFFIKQVNIHIFWSVILSLIESVDFGVLVHLYNMFYNSFYLNIHISSSNGSPFLFFLTEKMKII